MGLVATGKAGTVMGIAVVCSVYGDYDDVVEPPAGFEDAVLVTDRVHEVDGWRQVVLPQPGRHPRLAAKLAKCRPDLFTAERSSLWVDGNVRYTGGDLREATERHLEKGPLVVWEHPENRDCLVQEAEYCGDWKKYAVYRLNDQANNYLKRGMPRNWGLYACGLIARLHTPFIRRLGNDWLCENEQWSIQDQVSLPYLCWLRDFRPAVWDAEYASNPWIRWAGHNGLD